MAVLNAGANGVETRERLVEAHAIDRAGRRRVLSKADMGFTYRHSAAPNDLIFTEAVFAGPPSDRATIQAEMDAVPAKSSRPVVVRISGKRLEERRRTKIIPHAFGERPVLKLMYAAVIRAADRWRGSRSASSSSVS